MRPGSPGPERCSATSTAPGPRMSRLTLLLSLAALVCAVSAASAATWYSQGSASPNPISSWNSDRAGAGVAPADFASGDVFVIQGGHTLATTAAWNLGGATATLRIEAGGTLTANHL